MEKTTIQWCDDTENPVEGCDGCPLWPTPGKVRSEVVGALVSFGLEKASARKIVADVTAGLTASEMRLLRDEIAGKIKRRVARANGKRSLQKGQLTKLKKSIMPLFRCYAGTLHVRWGRNPLKPDKHTNTGMAPYFELVTKFPGRMAKAARRPDLAGRRRPDKPWLGDLPRMIFVSDMGDALSSNISFTYLRDEIVQVAASPKGRRHIWLWLTKRPARMAKFAAWLDQQGIAWPQNLVPMASVIDRKMAKSIHHLLKIPAAARGLSVEPLWEQVELDLTGFDWVIVGGESGPYAYEFDLEWARDIRRQCRKAGCAFFVKQLGAKPIENGERLVLADGHGGDWNEWPKDLRVRKMPKAFRHLTTAMETVA